MDEKKLAEFIELATSGRREVSGFAGQVKISKVSHYQYLIFRCQRVTDNMTIYRSNNHTVIIRYKNIAGEGEIHGRYTGFVAEYIAPVTELTERSGF